MRAPTKKHMILRPVRPNVGLEAHYRRELEKLVDEMNKSIEYWLTAAYRAHPPQLAQDDILPANALRDTIKSLTSRWQSRFDKAAKDLAKYFGQAMKDRSDKQLRQILKDGGFSIEFVMTKPMRDVMNATIAEQVGLIRNLSQSHLSEIEGLVMRSVTKGGDLGTLTKELRKRYGMTRRRAALIARHQNSIATATMNRVRQNELGITEAIWVHSHGGAKPRPEHVAWGAKAKRYKIAKGMWSEVDGAYVWPGTAINCRCVCRSIILGFA